LGKEAGQEVTNDTTNGVGGENIEGIIVSEDELELGRKVTNGASHETKEDGGGRADKNQRLE